MKHTPEHAKLDACYATLHHTMLDYTILFYTILDPTVLYCAGPCWTTVCQAVLYYTVLYCTVLYYIVLHHTALCCYIWQCTLLDWFLRCHEICDAMRASCIFSAHIPAQIPISAWSVGEIAQSAEDRLTIPCPRPGGSSVEKTACVRGRVPTDMAPTRLHFRRQTPYLLHFPPTLRPRLQEKGTASPTPILQVVPFDDCACLGDDTGLIVLPKKRNPSSSEAGRML